MVVVKTGAEIAGDISIREAYTEPNQDKDSQYIGLISEQYVSYHDYLTDFIEALDLLEGMTIQCCSIDTNDGKVGELDSMCLHSYVDAIRFLVKHNRAVIKSEQGRRIIAILKENK